MPEVQFISSTWAPALSFCSSQQNMHYCSPARWVQVNSNCGPLIKNCWAKLHYHNLGIWSNGYWYLAFGDLAFGHFDIWHLEVWLSAERSAKWPFSGVWIEWLNAVRPNAFWPTAVWPNVECRVSENHLVELPDSQIPISKMAEKLFNRLPIGTMSIISLAGNPITRTTRMT